MRHLIGCLVVLLVGATPARAGVLGKVIDGISNAADSDDDQDDDGDSSSSSSGSSAGEIAGAVVDGLLHSSDGGWSTDPTVTVHPGYMPAYSAPGQDPMEVQLYLGIQSVEGSDGSVTMEMLAAHRDFGIGLRGTSFYEAAEVDGTRTYLQLDLGSIDGHYRVLQTADSQAWLEAGFVGVSTSDQVALFGAQAGVHAEHKLGGELRIGAEARHYWMEEGVRILEGRLSLHASVLRLSYRIVDFNVGPPLKGPELGVLLHF